MTQPSPDTPRSVSGPDPGPSGRPADLRAWVRQARHRNLAEIVEALQADQLQRWGKGERVPAEAYLQLHPALAGAAEALDLIYGEFLLRQQRGETPTLDEYLWRFPQHETQLRLMVELEGELAAAGIDASSSDELVSTVTGPPDPPTPPAEGEPGTVPQAPDRVAAMIQAGQELLAPQGAPEARRILGYEVLGELGRGGMGVVYQARQVGLNRLVALKMIRAGSYAGPAELARFRAEAEAVARLQHPNIVQIYEIGECHGLPYFSLEFCAGGSLADHLHGTPLPPPQAAELAETLARAVHAAHQAGVVHRDLKPANVLLSFSGGSETRARVSDPPLNEFVPKVTDFGLAKRLDEAVGLTAADAVVGTPSYMAPEQAEGRVREVATPADVYALGAILYELLTGRPPFKAATTLETLEQVRSQEPVPPRRLQPKTPRDLETICLKGLEKSPRTRYASAAALADDLRRFRAGEPIQARPTPAWERVVKWARRRPAVATLAAVSGLALTVLLMVILAAYSRVRHERDLADQRREQAEAQRRRAVVNLHLAAEAVDRMLTRVGRDRLAAVPYMETVRRELHEDALQFYRELARQEEADPELRSKAGRAQRQLGNFQRFLGDTAKAEQNFREALAVQEELATAFPDEPAYRQELAAGCKDLGNLLRVRNHPDAEPLLRRAVRLGEALVDEAPARLGSRQALAESLSELGDLLKKNRPPEAEQAFRRAVDLMEKVVADAPADLDAWDSLLDANGRLATFLAETKQVEEAEKAFRRNLDRWERLIPKTPGTPRYRDRLARDTFNLGYLLETHGRPRDGEQLYRRSAAGYQRLAEEYPTVPSYHTNLAYVLRGLGMLIRGRDLRESCRLLEQAIEQWRLARKAAPRDPGLREALGRTYGLLASYRVDLGAHREAASAAAQVPPDFTGPGTGYSFQATILAQCVPLAEKDPELTEDQHRQQALAYADQAMQLLRQAVKRGHKDVNFLRKDPGLESLRRREDFQKLLGELAPEARPGKEEG
jgi:serine/threonine protein kinase/tetratricopeptide (TPR) repeat protein